MLVLLVCLFIVKIYCQCPSASNGITMSDIKAAVYASEQIYDDGLVEGKTISGTKFKVIKRYHKQLMKDGEGIRVIIADAGNTRMVVYRGTDGFEQLVAQGSSVIFGKEQEWIIGGVKTEVAKFVYEAFRLSSYRLKGFIWDSSKKYILTGHSLGGALASMLALESTQLFGGSIWRDPSSSLITFGQPRVGNAAYQRVHDKLISTYRKLRFVYKADPVVSWPLYMFGWRHHSRAVFMGTRLVYTGFGRKRNAIGIKDQGDSNEPNNEDNCQTMRVKRFLWKSKAYWQVCGTGDAFRCVKGLTNLKPSISDHGIAKYRDSIVNPPTTFLTKNGDRKSSLLAALLSTCYDESE